MPDSSSSSDSEGETPKDNSEAFLKEIQDLKNALDEITKERDQARDDNHNLKEEIEKLKEHIEKVWYSANPLKFIY